MLYYCSESVETLMYNKSVINNKKTIIIVSLYIGYYCFLPNSQTVQKERLKYALMEIGDPFVEIIGAIMMQVLHVNNSDIHRMVSSFN